MKIDKSKFIPLEKLNKILPLMKEDLPLVLELTYNSGTVETVNGLFKGFDDKTNNMKVMKLEQSGSPKNKVSKYVDLIEKDYKEIKMYFKQNSSTEQPNLHNITFLEKLLEQNDLLQSQKISKSGLEHLLFFNVDRKKDVTMIKQLSNVLGTGEIISTGTITFDANKHSDLVAVVDGREFLIITKDPLIKYTIIELIKSKVF